METTLLVSADGHTLVEVRLDGSERTFFFIIDTGSRCSYVSPAFASSCNHFNLGEKHYTHALLKMDVAPWMDKQNIVGLLGIDFLLRNRLIVDYQRMLMYVGHSRLSRRNHAFEYPMTIGLNKVGVPIVGMSLDNEIMACVADTGSDSNLISKSRGVFKPVNADRLVNTVNGEVCGCEQHLHFWLSGLQRGKLSWKKQSDDFTCVSFDMWKHNIYRQGAVNVDSILGNRFLVKHEFVFDFHNKIIFSDKI